MVDDLTEADESEEMFANSVDLSNIPTESYEVKFESSSKEEMIKEIILEFKLK
jgi:hypothetical protein